jgi:hypothetical protein
MILLRSLLIGARALNSLHVIGFEQNPHNPAAPPSARYPGPQNPPGKHHPQWLFWFFIQDEYFFLA